MTHTCFEIMPTTQLIQQYTEEFTLGGSMTDPTSSICLDLLRFSLRDHKTVAYHQVDMEAENFTNGEKLYHLDNNLLTTAHVDAKTLYDGTTIQTANYDLYHLLSVGRIAITHDHLDTDIYFFGINGCSHQSALTDTIIPWDLADNVPLTELNTYFT
jgi:hypothetical protein